MLRQILDILDHQQKRRYLYVLIAVILMAIFEVVGIASILPFMQLVAEPESIENIGWFSKLSEWTGLDQPNDMITFFGVGVIFFLVVGNALKIIATWLQQKFAWDVSHEIGMKLLRTYLNKPYLYFTNTNTSDILSVLIVESSRATTGVLLPASQMVSYAIVSFLIGLLLLVVNPVVTLVTLVVLCSVFYLIYLLVNPFLKGLGNEKIESNKNRFLHLRELITGIKTFRVFNSERHFYKRYSDASYRHSVIQPKVSIVGILPKHVFDALVFSLLVGGVIFFIRSEDSATAYIPLISLYVFAGYKLLPAIQRVYNSAVNFRHAFQALEIIRDELHSGPDHFPLKNEDINSFSFVDNLRFSNLSFAYDDEDWKIKDLNFTVLKGDKVAFVGSTGSGKSTVIDLIVGLIFPQKGSFMVDQREITYANAKSWQKCISYVSQDIFLFDDTLEQNIVLGQNEAEIDHEYLKKVLQCVDLSNFVNTDLNDGLQTLVGERGVRLSGGQKQRIGLARALYRRPQLLVLDEATSALDNITEKKIIENLDEYFSHMTMIMVAHRISTVKYCDRIFLLEHGRLTSAGNYDELIRAAETFEQMAKINN